MTPIQELLQAIAYSPSSATHPVVEKLLADKKFGETFPKLIRTYVESGFNMTTTALELGYHRNTVKYHLEKVKEALGYDEWDTAGTQDFIALYIALEAKEVSRATLVDRSSRDDVTQLDVGGMAVTIIAHRDYDVWDTFHFAPSWVQKEVPSA